MMTLLIIDKSKLIAERLLLLANDAEHIDEAYTATNYTEVMAQLQQRLPDIVLMDMNMPGSKSIELIKTLKKIDGTISFVILFNQVNEIKKQYCEFLGVDFIFDKYHDVEKIIPAINSLSNRKNKILNPCIPKN